jgi:hypothetical protein
MTPRTVELPCIAFNGSTRYSRQGDTITLSADRIDNLDEAGVASADLCLQLWACQSPYSGGELTGWKLAEITLGVLSPGHFLAPVESSVAASFPESGDFAIVLVIAEWDGEAFNRIHDFHNYPCRDVFIHPRLQGMTGYRWVDENRLVVDVERIDNPREPDNLSGALVLELWALAEPYQAGDFRGHALGSIALGSLAGGDNWQNLVFDMEVVLPPAGVYSLVLMLREWNGSSYVTRDHCNFRYRVTFPLDISSPPAATDGALEHEPNDQAGHPVQGAEQVDDVPGAEDFETGPVTEAGAGAFEAPQPDNASQTVQRFSPQFLFDYAKRVTRPLRVWVRQHW